MPNGNNDEIAVRQSLLNYYSSETIAHGTHLLTAAIGIFAFVKVIDKIEVMDKFHAVFQTIVLSLFLTASLFLSCRISFWGIMTSYAPYVSPLDYDEAACRLQPGRCRGENQVTLFYMINERCLDVFRRDHRPLSILCGIGQDTKYVLLEYAVLWKLIFVLLWLGTHWCAVLEILNCNVSFALLFG